MDFNSYMAMLNPETAAQVGSFYGHSPTAYVQAPTYTQGPLGLGPFMTSPGFATGSPHNPYAHINPYRYSGMNPKDQPGDQLLADLIRAQTRDYNTRFAPIENMLAGSITRTGTTYLQGDLERTQNAVLGASQNVQGMTNRAAERLGVNGAQLNPNATTSTLVGGMNETRMRDADRRLELLTGGLSGITQGARNIGR